MGRVDRVVYDGYVDDMIARNDREASECLLLGEYLVSLLLEVLLVHLVAVGAVSSEVAVRLGSEPIGSAGLRIEFAVEGSVERSTSDWGEEL